MPARHCGVWPRLTADSLRAVAEPLRWRLQFGARAQPANVAATIRAAARGPIVQAWTPPQWLLPHQVDAARRIAGSLEVFGTALLADAVGLGKTYVALAVAARYDSVTVVVPASLLAQWRRVARACGRPVALQTHEALSRRAPLRPARLVIVDEAHRFRNPSARRYDRLARSLCDAHLLLVTATPVVNRAADLGHLLSLGLTDHALRTLGLDSIRIALEDRAYRAVTRAAQPLLVARSHREVPAATAAMPQPRDAPTVAVPPMPPPQLRRAVALIDRLRFPSLEDGNLGELLRLHLCHRLASSAGACRETVKHHLSYLDRAIRAARRGESLSRATARTLFGAVDDWQLEFAALPTGAPRAVVDPTALLAERERVERLLRALPRNGQADPKAARLERLLERTNVKTIVFTNAVRTALDLARRLRWRRVAVIGAGKAWIASGAVAPEAALRRFAPHARGARPPPAAEQLSLLIATDLVSEGLDLQDAKAIVHYDLPWSPLRLAQRLGRIARLGSPHDAVDVLWFRPPIELERRLRLLPRLARKARLQAALGVSTTSVVGTARVTSALLHGRERFAQARAQPDEPGVAVVAGASAGVVVIEWQFDDHGVPELLLWNERGLAPATDYRELSHVVEYLARRPRCAAPIPPALVRSLCELVRERLSLADRPPADPTARRLARTILRCGQMAGRRRAVKTLQNLDAALDAVFRGLRLGGVRELADLLEVGCGAAGLPCWLSRWQPQAPPPSGFRVKAALVGAGDG